MIPMTQKNRHRPQEGVWGDCHRAAICSILELPVETAPNFGEGGPDGPEFNRRVNEWLKTQGLWQAHVVYDGSSVTFEKLLEFMESINPGVYYLSGGRSRNGVDHTVVCIDAQVAHDPSIDGSGIVGPCGDGLYWITFLVPLRNTLHA